MEQAVMRGGVTVVFAGGLLLLILTLPHSVDRHNAG